MKATYYPGCTLKTKARNLEDAAIASIAFLGIELEELPRWNCCGAVHSLADDDLIHQIAPVRVLIRAKEQGSDKLVTLCSMCYNTLARANLMMRNDEEKRKTINLFMDEEIDYHGEVEVVHFLNFLQDEIGWHNIHEKIKVPLTGFRVAPYYGCTLQRPRDVGIEPPGRFKLMTRFLETLGTIVVDFPAADLCCGSYQTLGNPDAAGDAASTILKWAVKMGAEALVLSCPLCEFNLGKKQGDLKREEKISEVIPTFYFTQLLAVALGLSPEMCRFELNERCSIELLKKKNYL
ncbi:MAG: CoB--CoM heterodisulfide reductase iron-sulfur subunit B family protein [Thermodesulfobacteriota bacterium]|nr:CoB--CoM heterodisulfide reductase iron-sulfur subunit B family protein [Thermodesulfobacteriota bacterium]